MTGFDRTAQQGYFLFSYAGRKFYEPGSFYQTDSSFFQVFPSLLLKGDPTTVLNDHHNLVLSEKLAHSIFGNEDPIGKRLSNGSPSYSQVSDFVITGVMKDVPENAHFHLNFIARNSNNEEVDVSNYWTGPRFYTYLTLAPGADPRQVSERLNHLIGVLAHRHSGYVCGGSTGVFDTSQFQLHNRCPD
ncbi:MAG TPA: ABC transporter permease [Chryseolinea sp.]|nr:ABC transporter permease [Chryseolinea sp.]